MSNLSEDQVSKTTLIPGADPMVDPWIELAAIALHTCALRLGLLVTSLPRRRPWMVARETVSFGSLVRNMEVHLPAAG